MIKNKYIILPLIILAPYIYLAPLSFGFIAMGNDFDLIYFSYKKYLFEFLNEGIFPFWSAGESSGFTLIYNPFAQIFYIPGYFNFLLLKLKGTFSLHDYLLFTIFGISVFNIGLFYWLNFFNNNKTINLIVVLVCTSCLLITGFIKFPNAVHSFAWFPYILLGLNYSFFYDHRLKSFCLIFFPLLFLVTAGYPYFVVYFSLFLMFYFFFILFYLINFNSNVIFFEKRFIISFLSRNLFSFGLPIFLTFPWIKGVKSTLDLTNNRNIQNVKDQFDYATEHPFNFIDILGSWIYPIASNTAGRYSFGIFVSIVIIFYLISYFINKNKNSKENYLILSCLFFFVLISSFAANKSSILFNLVWENFDSIKNLRTWPRINILLIPIIALLLSFGLKYITNENRINKNHVNKINQKFIILSISFLIFFSQIYLFINKFQSSYWLVWQKKRFDYASEVLGQPFDYILNLYNGEVHLIFTLIVMTVIFVLFNSKNLFYNKKKIFLSLFVIITYCELFVISNLQWSLDNWKTPNTHLKFNMKKEFTNQLNNNREFKKIYGNNFFRDRKFQINNFMDWGYQNHVKIIREYYRLYPSNGMPYDHISANEIDNFRKFYGIEKNTKVFLSSRINHDNINSFINDTEEFNLKNNFDLKINWENYYGDFLEINLTSQVAGWITFVDNWDPYWKAYINQNEVKIEKLFNSYKSVRFNKGTNIIQFIYEPLKFITLSK